MSYKSGHKVPEYTQEQLDVAIELAAKGEPIKRITEAIITTEIDFWTYRQQYPDFKNAFEYARQEGLEQMADGLITAADEYVDVQRGRLKSDNVKWLLSKRKPEVYGDKVDIHVSQTIDITAALTEARARAVAGSTIKDVVESGDEQKKLSNIK
jgi:hypothetical protein